MFTLSAVVATISMTVITADSLVLYFPVYPQYVVPKHLQSFERNAPPRIFAKDPDMPSSGIVFLRKDLKKTEIDWKAKPEPEKNSTSRQKLQSDRSGVTQQSPKPILPFTTDTVEPFDTNIDYAQYDTEEVQTTPVQTTTRQVPRTTTVSAAITNSAIPQYPRNMPIRLFANFDSNSERFVTRGYPKSIRRKEYGPKSSAAKSFFAQLSKAYRVETTQPAQHDGDTEAIMFAQRNQQPTKRPQVVTVAPNFKMVAIAPKVLGTKISNQNRPRSTVVVLDGDTTAQQFKRVALLRLL